MANGKKTSTDCADGNFIAIITAFSFVCQIGKHQLNERSRLHMTLPPCLHTSTFNAVLSGFYSERKVHKYRQLVVLKINPSRLWSHVDCNIQRSMYLNPTNRYHSFLSPWQTITISKSFVRVLTAVTRFLFKHRAAIKRFDISNTFISKIPNRLLMLLLNVVQLGSNLSNAL